jgi:hypothetical protein
MRNWWTELWSVGDGFGRTYCGIARTPDGFALDVFRGDTCLESTLHASWGDAEREASTLKRRYRRRRPAAQPAWHTALAGDGLSARQAGMPAVLHAAHK